MRKQHLGLLAGVMTLAGVLCAMIVGCSNDLPKATLIAHMRVLGAWTRVQGDPTRGTPKPGETARLTWAMAYPSVTVKDSELSSLFITCTAPTRFTGIPTCQEFIDAVQNPGSVQLPDAGPQAGPPETRVSCDGYEGYSVQYATVTGRCVVNTPMADVPIEADSKVPAKLVIGIICKQGTPYVDATKQGMFGCDPKPGVKASDVESIAVYDTVAIEHAAADENQNPDLGVATLKLTKTKAELDGASAWPETSAADLPTADDDCRAAAEATHVLVGDGEQEVIRIAYPAAAREHYDNTLETIEFSNYVSAGTLQRRFTLFTPDHAVVNGQLQDEVTWTLTSAEKKQVGPGGLLVRFYFSVLDHRGGFDLAMRTLCVLR